MYLEGKTICCLLNRKKCIKCKENFTDEDNRLQNNLVHPGLKYFYNNSGGMQNRKNREIKMYLYPILYF